MNRIINIIVLILILVGGVLILAPNEGITGPYCAVHPGYEECHFYNYQECQRAAGSEGACIPNPQEIQQPNGSSPFCVVTSYGTQCHYWNVQECRQAAYNAGAVCVINRPR
ncbi:MAG: hypothetical protein ABIU05_20985 [Nitrospirales bacterium]